MEQNPRIQIAPDEELQLSSAEVRAILADRASKLASGYAQVAEAADRNVHLIAFSRGEHRYGVELKNLTEIRPLVSWTPVPGIPSYYLGVTQLRGEIIAVVDIAVLFGAAVEPSAGERFGVVVMAGDVATALLADTVDDVHDLAPEHIHPPLATFDTTRERYIRGLTEDGLAILDVERLLGDEWLRVSQEPLEDRR
jgi:purine-binding chemotaxis protein CheW